MNKKFIILCFSGLLVVTATLALRGLNASQVNSNVFISEICSGNKRIIYDWYGEYRDYVELYNPMEYAVDISGYMLQDDKKTENVYVIEDEIIEANSYKVVFPNKFGISDNETIYLLDSEGNKIDSVKVPVLAEDTSYALDFEKNKWGVMQATPETENFNQSIVDNVSLDIVKPEFSTAPGFYKEPFRLEIKVPEGTDVYYTLDGTEPTTESVLYELPIYIEDVSYKENLYASADDVSTRNDMYIPYYPVDKANIVRAIAVDKDGKQSVETNGSYFVGYDRKEGYQDIYTVSIITNPKNMFGFVDGIYVKGKVWAANWDEEKAKENSSYRSNAKANYRMEGPGWRREAYLELYDKNRKLLNSQQIEIGIHGGWSVTFNQKSFNLYALPNKDGHEYLCEGFLANKETTQMLRAGGYRDLYSTKFREVLNHRLVENRAIGTLRAVPCQVFLNGEYWGLYSFQERIDESYIENNYGVSADNVIILKNKEVVAGEDTDYQLYRSVVQYAQNNDLSDQINYDYIKQHIDIQSYIDYYCFQIYVANTDSITNNYALWRSKRIENDQYCDGRWRWILYDTDDSTGMVDDMSEPEVNSFITGYWDISPMEDELFSALFKNEEFKSIFAETFVEMAQKNFAPDRVNRMIDAIYQEYAEGSVLSHRRFINEEYTKEKYLEEVEVVRDFYNRRPEFILKYLNEIIKK